MMLLVLLKLLPLLLLLLSMLLLLLLKLLYNICRVPGTSRQVHRLLFSLVIPSAIFLLLCIDLFAVSPAFRIACSYAFLKLLYRIYYNKILNELYSPLHELHSLCWAKNRGRKSRDTVPLIKILQYNFFYVTLINKQSVILSWVEVFSILYEYCISNLNRFCAVLLSQICTFYVQH